MSAIREQPPWSPWLLRVVLMGVSACCGVLSAVALIFFFWVLSLSARNRLLLPISLLLLPVALVVIVVGCPLWAVSAACGMKLHQLEGVYAKVGADGLRLQSVYDASPRQVEWEELEEVLKIHYPLCAPYLFKLKRGPEVRVDFVDEGLLKRHLGERSTRFQEVWGSRREPYPG
jgi:hypothetical protein